MKSKLKMSVISSFRPYLFSRRVSQPSFFIYIQAAAEGKDSAQTALAGINQTCMNWAPPTLSSLLSVCSSFVPSLLSVVPAFLPPSFLYSFLLFFFFPLIPIFRLFLPFLLSFPLSFLPFVNFFVPLRLPSPGVLFLISFLPSCLFFLPCFLSILPPLPALLIPSFLPSFIPSSHLFLVLSFLALTVWLPHDFPHFCFASWWMWTAHTEPMIAGDEVRAVTFPLGPMPGTESL